MDVLEDLVNIRSVGFYVPKNIHDTAKKIRDLDPIEDGAVNLVTLDRKLIGHSSIEREFRLRIVHPKDLL